jgi:DNA polymerase elongation subunit (family B)
LNLVNIYNNGRELTLFIRENDRKLNIVKETNFFPYFYEVHPDGKCLGFDGKKLKKILVSHPGDIKKTRTNTAYEADLQFTKRFIIDRVDELTPAPLRWMMMDIETQSKTLPAPRETRTAPDPVSCIVLYDNYEDRYIEFFRPKFKNEFDMLLAFCEEVRGISPDILLAHNMLHFDYPYLFYRIPELATRISPIRQPRYGDKELQFPAGISIVDTLEWWKKLTLNKEESYALDALMAKYLGYDKGRYKHVDFSKIDDNVLGRCRGDVEGMVALEKKKQMIPYFDMIRRIGMVEWEDLNWNSRIIDMALLKEAKNQNVVLPMKPQDAEDSEFEGAFRDAFKTGVFKNVGKYDLSGAYCYAIIDLCLDSVNIVDGPGEGIIKVDIHDRETHEVTASYYVKQNPSALLPKVVNKFVSEKNKLKALMNKTDPNAPEYKDIEQRYAGFKSVVLSAWGVIGNKFFRRYDGRVAAMTTGTVRNLLHYIFDELKKLGQEVIYIDTDSAFIMDGGTDISPMLNGLIQKWAQEKFGKSISIGFDHEGHFKDIFILAKCRYRGHLDTGHGIKDEIKGIEQKRKDSTAFMKKFQKTLFDKCLAEEPKQQILDWVQAQINDIKKVPLVDIAKPCKLGKKPEEYKSKPIFVRALEETPGFTKSVGDNFFYVYVKPEYTKEIKKVVEYYREVPGKRAGTTKKEKLKVSEITALSAKNEFDILVAEGKIKRVELEKEVIHAKNVQAFDEDHLTHLREVDWEKAIEVNILKKLVAPFVALGWTEELKKFNAAELVDDEEVAEEVA